MTSAIRIIGGKYRGKKIYFPEIPTIRPTPNRIRETVFNWLMQDIQEARCLDAFAGSGALGFEAFSRGAKEVIFLETEAVACKNLLETIKNFNSNQLRLIEQNALLFLDRTHPPFDIIFLDPPFKEKLLMQALDLIKKHALIHEETLIYIESGSSLKNIGSEWVVRKESKAGTVFYGLLSLGA